MSKKLIEIAKVLMYGLKSNKRLLKRLKEKLNSLKKMLNSRKG